jgi:DNA adenine methylase
MMHSPLRYPGGKSDFFACAREIFESSGCRGLPVVEPYAGSAAVSLGLLDFDLTPHVTLVERDPLVFAFWHAAFFRTDEFITRFQDLPITLQTWNDFQPLLALKEPDPARIVDMGLAGLFFNRANFSGILAAGPIGGKQQASRYKIDCRTNKDDIISRLLALAMHSDRVAVAFGDAIDWIKRFATEKKVFFYLDPPYFKKGELIYRHFYGILQHRQLANELSSASFKWLLSYDDHPVIEFLYEETYVQRLSFRYSAYSPKNHAELLISNFPVVVPAEFSGAPVRRQRHSTVERSTSPDALGGDCPLR